MACTEASQHVAVAKLLLQCKAFITLHLGPAHHICFNVKDSSEATGLSLI